VFIPGARRHELAELNGSVARGRRAEDRSMANVMGEVHHGKYCGPPSMRASSGRKLPRHARSTASASDSCGNRSSLRAVRMSRRVDMDTALASISSLPLLLSAALITLTRRSRVASGSDGHMARTIARLSARDSAGTFQTRKAKATYTNGWTSE